MLSAAAHDQTITDESCTNKTQTEDIRLVRVAPINITRTDCRPVVVIGRPRSTEFRTGPLDKYRINKKIIIIIRNAQDKKKTRKTRKTNIVNAVSQRNPPDDKRTREQQTDFTVRTSVFVWLCVYGRFLLRPYCCGGQIYLSDAVLDVRLSE